MESFWYQESGDRRQHTLWKVFGTKNVDTVTSIVAKYKASKKTQIFEKPKSHNQTISTMLNKGYAWLKL